MACPTSRNGRAFSGNLIELRMTKLSDPHFLDIVEVNPLSSVG
jgi:hypothetical protein